MFKKKVSFTLTPPIAFIGVAVLIVGFLLFHQASKDSQPKESQHIPRIVDRLGLENCRTYDNTLFIAIKEADGCIYTSRSPTIRQQYSVKLAITDQSHVGNTGRSNSQQLQDVFCELSATDKRLVDGANLEISFNVEFILEHPVHPERPDSVWQIDYWDDDEGYEVAMAEYDDALEIYNQDIEKYDQAVEDHDKAQDNKRVIVDELAGEMVEILNQDYNFKPAGACD